MKPTFLTLAILFSWAGLACKPSAPKEISVHTDLEKGIRKFYNSKRLLSNRPSLSFDSCQDTARSKNYLMIGLGLENLVLTNDIMGFSFTPQEETLDCKLENNPFSLQESKDDRFLKNQQKRDFFNRCIVVQVTEFNENVGLEYPENQPGCKITKKSKWSVDFEGAYCFFSPKPESNISVHLDIKEECMKASSIAKKETILGDYTGLLNSYIAGDASGFSADLTAISTTQVRVSITPPKGLIPLSDDFGKERPVWPTDWQAADLYMGQIEVNSNQLDFDEIKVPLVASTICERKCKDNLCTSACDYAQPVVGEFSLYEIVDGKREFIKLWHDGSVASPNYQGLLHGMGITIPTGVLQEGKLYEIEGLFREPDLDYSYFSGRINRELRFRDNFIGPLQRSGTINLVPEINTIGNTQGVPDVPLIRNLTFENNELDQLSLALATWQSKLNNAFWPPFYEKMCDSKGKCEKAGTGFVNLNAQFTLTKKNDTDWDVNLVSGKRTSNIVSAATWTQDQIPAVDCGLNDDSDDDDDFDWGDIL